LILSRLFIAVILAGASTSSLPTNRGSPNLTEAHQPLTEAVGHNVCEVASSILRNGICDPASLRYLGGGVCSFEFGNSAQRAAIMFLSSPSCAVSDSSALIDVAELPSVTITPREFVAAMSAVQKLRHTPRGQPYLESPSEEVRTAYRSLNEALAAGFRLTPRSIWASQRDASGVREVQVPSELVVAPDLSVEFIVSMNIEDDRAEVRLVDYTIR
jgi:hypothetical protein